MPFNIFIAYKVAREETINKVFHKKRDYKELEDFFYILNK